MESKSLRLITAVVQRSYGTPVVEAALKAGATGATYFDALGSGVRENLRVFAQLIEAEKQVVLIVTTPEALDPVLKAVSDTGQLRKPGYGFAFVQDVLNAVGFVPPTGDKPAG